VRANAKGLLLAYQIGADVPDVLVGDSGRLTQIIVNLVGNAIKFTEEGEVVVTIELANSDPVEPKLVLTVQDTGIGIPFEEQSRIFDRFTRGGSAGHLRSDGSGLGLAIVSQLAAHMSGRVSVKSAPGEGSRFEVTLVVRRPPVESKEDEHAWAKDTEVLVVHDQDAGRAMVGEALSRWGMKLRFETDPKKLASRLGTTESPAPRLCLIDGTRSAEFRHRVAEEISRVIDRRHTGVVLLVPIGQPIDATWLQKMQIRHCMAWPTRESRLLAVAANALGVKVRERSAEHRQPLSGSPRPGRRVLLAEDGAVNQTLVRRLLEKRGHMVELVEDGEAAFERVCADHSDFDLVLMDVQMPILDGIEATKKIRRFERTQGLPHLRIVALTAHAMKGDREQCMEAGMDGYLSKPTPAAELYAVVEHDSH
ncbi:MAG: response regulator, partial [Myxococcales bacterium]|nr:response regulator [Myxococcales bacterium]